MNKKIYQWAPALLQYFIDPSVVFIILLYVWAQIFG